MIGNLLRSAAMKLGLVWCLLLLPTVVFAERKWREKLDCRLIPNESNDGDSFHVKWHTREYIFRLLFVDTCESETSLPERLAEQAAYFGISDKDVVRMGKEAKKFSADWLKEPFTAYTQFDDAMGRSDKDRDYAIITRGDEDLAVALVSRGLARIHGKQEVPDDMASVQTIRFRLKKAEADARQNKLGAWAFSTNMTPSRFAPPPSLPTRPALQPAVPTPTLTAAPAAAMLPDITQQQVSVPRALQVYSLLDPTRLVGYLTAGKEITVLKSESPTMVRIRFSGAEGKVFEAQCRRADLGI